MRCPAGVAIAAETAEEIAVSILAELIAVRRGAPFVRTDETTLETKEASKTPSKTDPTPDPQ